MGWVRDRWPGRVAPSVTCPAEQLGVTATGGQDHLFVDALADLEDLHVMIMDVVSAPPADKRPGWLAPQAEVQAEVKTEPDLVLACPNMLTCHDLADTNNDAFGALEQFDLTKLGRALAE